MDVLKPRNPDCLVAEDISRIHHLNLCNSTSINIRNLHFQNIQSLTHHRDF